MDKKRLFLGLDSSTQSLSAIVIDYDARKIVYESSVNFDEALPRYGTQNGVLPNSDLFVKHSPPQMWADALEVLLARMKRDGVALGNILAIAGSGQQHGSVYLNAKAAKAFATGSFTGIYSRPTSPIWMDSSTGRECTEIRGALGGIKATAEATGSDAFERFTGPQIRKFSKNDPKGYANTASIALVSSFMASIVAGKIAPIDHGDGAGMNLMDIRKKTWHPRALNATAPGLRAKLPELVESSKVIGKVSPYLASKFGINPEALALVWSGDNPCSLIGLGLVKPGMVAISLGTSDTLFGSMKTCRVDIRGEGHVFGAPTGDYMTLICFKNGSLARERLCAMYSLDWNGFNAALASTPPGNRGAIMLPWFEPEIVPRVTRPGIHRIKLDDRDAAANCRAMVEAQMMSMRLHSEWMKVKPTRVYATGGASTNTAILQVMADVMNCPVLRIEVSKSAALGAALRAAHGYLKHRRQPANWDKIVAGFTEPIPDSTIKPRPTAVKVYNKLIKTYAEKEQSAIKSFVGGRKL